VSALDPFGLTGQVLDGQFRVDGYVGEGGFSIVYRGTHIGLSEPIAVKCLKLPPALGSALVESFVRRFRDESRIHYRLSQGHLHIARSIASGTTVAPSTSALVPYTVLEWLDGRSLAEELEERRARGLGARTLGEAVKMLDSAIDALAYAHAQGVVHRDLNPGNLFLAKTPSGIKLKVLDFGVAKVLADSALAMGPAARTLGNVRIFTPSYGAPEQFDEGVGPIGPWTDVYAVALVVLEVLTGRTVGDGEHLGELAAKALDPAHRPTPRALGIEVGDEVEAAMACAVAISPDERPRDAGELWGLLKHAMAADAGSGRSPHAVPFGGARARSSATLRMAEVVPGGEMAVPALEVPRAGPEPRPGPEPLGGTLRMANAPRGTGPSNGSGASNAGPIAGSMAAPAAPRPLASSVRLPVLVVIVLTVFVLSALTVAWLLSPKTHAAMRGPACVRVS
jgi:eukaryotic-like serine/threonine-protein kinase